MVHEGKIKKIVVRVEFDCHGRTAYVDAEMGMDLLANPIALRSAIDFSIERFHQNNPPAVKQ